MSNPKIPQKAPYKVELEEGKKYFFCTCGKSETQPFCDGKHKGSEFRPKMFVAEKSGPSFLCGCKHSANLPFCDGKHKGL